MKTFCMMMSCTTQVLEEFVGTQCTPLSSDVTIVFIIFLFCIIVISLLKKILVFVIFRYGFLRGK